MTHSTTSRRVRAAGGFGRLGLRVRLVLLILSLALASAASLAPAAAQDAGGRGRGPGGSPGGPDGNPGATASWTPTTTRAVNLRSGPSMDSAVLAVIPAGTAVQVTGGWQGGFVPVVANGTWGFISGNYLGSGPAAQSAATPQAAAAAAAAPATAATAVLDGPLPVVIASDAVVADDAARSPEMVAIIYSAADAYGQSRADMLRVAACESNLDPNAVNEAGGSYGLFQFIPSTWGSTPYADRDIFDPVASANAAAWMWSVGRRAEWVCQ